MNLIEYIDYYFEDIKNHMEGILEELNKQQELNNQDGHLETVIWYYMNEIIFNMYKLEIYTRALRDKLENG